MRGLFIFGILFLLLIPVTLAGRTIDLDFSQEAKQAALMLEKDRVEFNLIGGTHTIVIDKIHKDGADLDVFPFKKEVTYVTASPKYSVKLDFDRDGIKDLRIDVLSLSDTDHKVMLLFEKIEEGKPTNLNTITGSAIKDNQLESKNNWTKIIIGAILLIIILIIVYAIVKRRGKKV